MIYIPYGVDSKNNITLLGLVNTGSTASLVSDKAVGPRCRKKKDTAPAGWNTQAGDFETTIEGNIDRVKIPQFAKKKIF